MLAVHGTTQTAVAHVLGVSTAYISRMLAGERREVPELRPALETLIGREAADEVLAAIPRETVAA